MGVGEGGAQEEEIMIFRANKWDSKCLIRQLDIKGHNSLSTISLGSFVFLLALAMLSLFPLEFQKTTKS